MNKVELTFGIPMYNCQKYIEELIKCFDFDSDINFEVLIVDDGSTDNSYEFVKKFKNSKLRIISQKNGGVSSARNRIIRDSRGKWLTFVDADDLIDFKKYVKYFKTINDTDEFLICIPNKKDYDFLIGNKEKVSQYLIENNLINSPCQRFYKRKIIVDNNIEFNSKFSLGEDALFNMNYKYYVKSIRFFNDDIYIYRSINNNSLTKKFRLNKIEELIDVNNSSLKFCTNDKEKRALAYVRVANCRGCLNDIYIYNDKFKTFAQKKSYIKKIKSYCKCNYIFLNRFKYTLRYWEIKILPISLLLFFIKCKRIKKIF